MGAFTATAAHADTDPFPAISYHGEIPGTRVSSSPGQAQSDWNQSAAIQNFSCPSGASSALEHNLNWTADNSDDVLSMYCIKTWQAQVVIDAWQTYRDALAAAQAAAEATSRAWNEANPGQQKCVQWGPITDPNGGTSSGGVCANPVGAGGGAGTPVQDADSVEGTIPVLTPNQNIVGSGKPFYKEVPGQVGTDACPVGYQAANGIVHDIAANTITTQCWSAEAWAAYQLGGVAWQKYQQTGGGYDVAAEIDRRAKVALLIAKAQTVAQAAADSTPGVKRCSKWTGYGETGTECAYTFVDPASLTNGSTGQEIVDPVSQEAPALLAAASLRVKSTAKATTKITSLTPKVCKVAGLKVKALKAGTCTYKVTVTKAKGKKSTVKKSVVFVR